jgi:hypothetical protein
VGERAEAEPGACRLEPQVRERWERGLVTYGRFLWVPGIGLYPFVLRWGLMCAGDEKCVRKAATGMSACWMHATRMRGGSEVGHDHAAHRGRVRVSFACLSEATDVLVACTEMPQVTWALNAQLDLLKATTERRPAKHDAQWDIEGVFRLQPDVVARNFPPRWREKPVGQVLTRRAVYMALLVAETISPPKEMIQ